MLRSEADSETGNSEFDLVLVSKYLEFRFMPAGHLLQLFICAMIILLSCGCTGDGDADGRAGRLSVAHILIMHEYSRARTPHITRTQIEALKRAQEVARKARAADADFAALARRYSDDTTGPNGGDLGVFRPSSVVPEFREATLALEVGAVSDPVRTAFGYHVILRKKP